MGKRARRRARAGWSPLERVPLNPLIVEASAKAGIDLDVDEYEAWKNDRYDVIVRRRREGSVHLSIKRLDRYAIHDWRHLQQIKNEILGEELLAIEIYPPESELIDTSNQYHLWHFPGLRFTLNTPRLVRTPEEVEADNAELGGRARQRPWERGLTTGRLEPRPASRERSEG
jgi:hypothetical protein